MSTLKIIQDQLHSSTYPVVQQTYQRLKSLNIPNQEVLKYLCWAYDHAVLQDDFDEKQYIQNLNQLPSTAASSTLQQFSEPVLKSDDTSGQIVKEMNMNDMVMLLKDLMIAEQNSLEDVVIKTYVFDVQLSDGYQLELRVLDKVKVLDVMSELANREALSYQQGTCALLQGDSEVILSGQQGDLALRELSLEEGDRLKFTFVQEQEQILLNFAGEMTEVYPACSLYQKEL